MDNTKLANPAPLGLMGFGMTTVLLNIHNAGFFPVSAVVLAMGIFYGGIAQIIAGIMEFKKGNTFGTIGLHVLRTVLADPRRHLGHPGTGARTGGPRPWRSWAGTSFYGASSPSSCGSARSARTGPCSSSSSA